MTSNEVKVVTADLKALAGAMRAVFWYQPDAQAMPPDQLPLALAATANLNADAAQLQQYQKIAEAEGHRLGEMLDAAAKAYDEVDEKYKTALDDPQRHAMVEGITLPPPSTPLPPLPDGPPAPQALDASGYSNIEQTHALLLSGSEASLRAAAVQWDLAADSAEGARPERKTTDWEGEAADAAQKRLNDYSDWCTDLGAAWRRLSQAATKIADAHVTAVTEHTPLYLRYLAAKQALARLLAEGDARSQVQAQHVQAEMAKLQQESDQVRQNYAGQATFDPVKVDKPGFASRGGTAGGTTSGSGGGGGGGGNPGGGQPLGAPQPPSAPANPQGTDPLSAAQTPSGSSGSGGSPTGSGGSPAGKGGGSPAGGGLPSGAGLPGGGLPDGGLPDPALDDPGVSPAGTGGGSGGGAGGGGGAPGMPLQPSVGAETVGPAPGGARGGGSGAIPASAMGGGMAGMGGGMGGMGHGGGAQPGKEKRRDPNLAPDEDLYTEDRPWTEGIIGARRRRDTPDKDQK
jgi:hypothetical protein